MPLVLRGDYSIQRRQKEKDFSTILNLSRLFMANITKRMDKYNLFDISGLLTVNVKTEFEQCRFTTIIL